MTSQWTVAITTVSGLVVIHNGNDVTIDFCKPFLRHISTEPVVIHNGNPQWTVAITTGSGLVLHSKNEVTPDCYYYYTYRVIIDLQWK
jgi:hypothetical protein